MPHSDSEESDDAQAPKRASRIKKAHRLEMESWLSLDRVYSGGKTGQKQKNIRWCLGAGAKGVKGMGSDSKECKASGAFERLANHMNKEFSLKKAGDAWTTAIAETRFKNIMKTFRDACRKYPLPREKDFSNDKNALATAQDLCNDHRKKKCSSYVALWFTCGLKDHPKFSGAGKMESTNEGSSDDFETERGDDEDDDDDGDESSSSVSSSEDASRPGGALVSTSKGASSPRSPRASSPRSAATAKSPGSKRVASQKAQHKGVKKRKKFALKKHKSTTKHQDIVEAYLICKKQQNEHFLQLSILSQRRQVFFDCWDRGIRTAQAVQSVYEAIGIGEPAYLVEPLSAIERDEEEENNGGEDQMDGDAVDGDQPEVSEDKD